MAFECIQCNRKFVSKESLEQHQSAKHSKSEKVKKTSIRKYIVFLIIGLILIFSMLTAFSYMGGSGDYDDFTMCLTEKGAVVYGNDFCSYTNKQLNFFGKSEKFLNYVKCSDNEELCDRKGVKVTPTWEIDGKMYEQIQTFERLSSLTGCKI